MRVLALFLLSGSLVTAQVKYPKVITENMRLGRAIIDDAIEALGGDAYRELTTKIEKGRVFSFYNQQLSGLSRATIYTKYLVAPTTPDGSELYIRERQAFGEDEKWSVLFNETGGYEVTFRGARPLEEERIKAYRNRRRKDIFYILLRRLNEDGMLFERRTREIIDNMPLDAVEITDGNNEAVTVYFHYRTKLPARQLFAWRDEQRIRHEELTIYDKYKDVGGGVMLPKVVQRMRDGEKVFSLFADTIEVNVPLDDNTLGLPGDIKILERK